jgi:hypothetical protein
MSAKRQREPHVLEWCLPVIYDCLSEFYRDVLPAANNAREQMTERHFALWSALVTDDFDHLHADRHLLEMQARTFSIDSHVWGAADRYVAAEILDISLRRFRRMPREARLNNEALLTVLTHLQQEENLYPERASLGAESAFAWAA